MKKKHLICICILLALAISSCRSNTPGTENKQLELLSQPVDSEYSESAIENVVNNELQSYVCDDFAVGNVIDFGVYNDQTLQWQVLTVDNGMALLFLNNNIQTEDGSDYALPYNEEGGKTTWSDCSLRAWLNNEFYENAFGNNKEAIILTTNCTGDYDEITIQPDDSSSGDETCGTVVVEYHSDGGEDTDDYVFVLSKEEVESYIGDVSLLPWSNMFYLRTPCADNNSVLMVKINTGEMIMCPGYQFDYGVRPAIWVDINYWSASD